MTKQRIYVVRSSDPDDVTLVRSSTQAQAIRHVVRDYTATVPSQETLVTLLGAGAVVEQARSGGTAEGEGTGTEGA